MRPRQNFAALLLISFERGVTATGVQPADGAA